MPTNLIREDQALIKASVDGITLPFVYSWTSLEGGHLEATNVNTRPGGMLPALELGGPAARTDVTVKRQYSLQLQPFIIFIEHRVGKGVARASYTMLDSEGNPNGPTVNLVGILKQVLIPNLDANNSSAAFLTLVIALNQTATYS